MNLVFEKHDLFLRYKVPYHVTHPSLKIGLSVPSYMLNLVDIASIKKLVVDLKYVSSNNFVFKL